MVYCGKPSRGCQMCRTRRIKCDETKPTCNQCAKSRRQCPGYKDEFDLVFRNETQATERRARKANKKAQAHKGGEQFVFQLGGGLGESSSAASARAVMPTLSVPVDQQAECHFISNFVLRSGEVSGGEALRGYCEYLGPLLRQDPPAPHLQHAFHAVSFALLNNRRASNPRLGYRALSSYTKALLGTNEALRNPATQYEDSTLASVLMLGIYEHISAKKIGSLAWGQHVEGAVQLVKSRGRPGTASPVGRALFNSVRSIMICQTILSGKPPSEGADWWFQDGVDETAAACQKLMIKTSEHRAQIALKMTEIQESGEEKSALMLQYARSAQQVDQQFGVWLETLPPDWQWRTVSWEGVPPDGDYGASEVYPGRVDLYRNLHQANLINSARAGRLVLASLIIRCAAWANRRACHYTMTPEYATHSRIASDMISDILASVPWHLGWHMKQPHLAQNADLNDYFACGDDAGSPKTLASYLLTWPLACMVGLDFVTDSQRAYMNGRLKHIAEEFGVKYAFILKSLHVRIPSMLIAHDGMQSQKYGKNHDFMKMVSFKTTETGPETVTAEDKKQHEDDDED